VKFKDKIIVISIVVLAALPVFYSRAVAEDTTSDPNTATSGSTDGSTTDDTTVEDKTAKLKERLQERKDEIHTKLTEYKKNRLKSRCKNAQGMLTSANARIKGVETSRKKVHENLLNRLVKLSGQLKDKGLDVTELNSQIETLKGMIAGIELEISDYKQAVSDVVEMTCVDDPEAFRASLDIAKEKLKAIKTSSAEIRAYLKDTIKVTLKGLRAQLESQEQGEDSSDDSNNTGGEQ